MSLQNRLSGVVSDEGEEEIQTTETNTDLDCFPKSNDNEVSKGIVFQEPIDVLPEKTIQPKKGGKGFSIRQSSFVVFVSTLIFFMIVAYIFFYYFS